VNKTIDELYLDIAQRIINTIDKEWTEATIDFQYLGDAGEFTGRYITSNSDHENDFKVGFKTYKDFKTIHSITTEGDSNQWNRAKFKLTPDNKFSIDFEWDQSLADEVARLNNS